MPAFGKITIKKAQEEVVQESRVDDWCVLVIDDEQGVLDITFHILQHFRFQGRGLSLQFAKSLSEAKALYEEYPHAAVALVDCAMEKSTSGLEFIRGFKSEVHQSLCC